MPHLDENQSSADDAPVQALPLDTSAPQLRVRCTDGSHEPLTMERLEKLLADCAIGLADVDLAFVAERVLGGCYDGIPEAELDKLLVNVPAALTAEEPEYAFLGARLLHRVIVKEVEALGVRCFSDSIRLGHEQGVIADSTAAFVAEHAAVLDAAIDHGRRDLFQYFGLRTVYDRYLLRHPTRRDVFETPQYFFLRVACGLSRTPEEAIEFYRLISSLEYMPSSPTLFNSGTAHSQMSSCYLLDSPVDELEGIYKRYTDIARLSKFAGGIGVAWHRVRARGSLIRGTNGKSNGIVPWLKTLDASVAAVNQGGRRKGAACVYLETWHGDIEEFLELRDNTGDEARRTHNLNLANWVPDLFMKRVQADEMWSLFDPKDCPDLIDSFGDDFEARYERYEAQGVAMRQVKARDLYARMMRTLAQTGNGWMTFKDSCNKKCNQTGKPGRTVHSSNLCTEIVEVTNQEETAVCNLGSINLSRFVELGEFNFEKLRAVVKVAVKYLDRVIDINYYPTAESRNSNEQWRPVGLGLMGLQDVMFLKRMDFDGPDARELSARIQEEVYYAALEASCDLAELDGAHETFWETRAARGQLQFDLWGVTPGGQHAGTQLGLFSGGGANRWAALKARIMEHGLRNSLLIAIAPTATIASICGCFECIEPQVSNLFKRETLSGEFLQINRYLVADLKRMGMWTDDVREQIKSGQGSIQHITDIPDSLRQLYRTAWELPQRALIDMHAERSPYIDQSASLNLFLASPTIGKLSSMYAYAWKRGLKTTYYLRSRPATTIARATGGTKNAKSYTESEAVACSLENPEYCEACQ
ncbi:MAG: ribonucleoside-diphosphate reductase subunit alpha [Alphaproteobacteria bacterium]|nr:ribonucleoside-diphosphate reductase subunit alpha [Alphaproteobacteria bacterium]